VGYLVNTLQKFTAKSVGERILNLEAKAEWYHFSGHSVDNTFTAGQYRTTEMNIADGTRHLISE